MQTAYDVMAYMKQFKTSLLILVLLTASFTTQAAEVITNNKNIHHTMTQNKLRSIFAMRLQEWPDGSAIVVYVLQDRYPLHLEFSKNILGIFPYQLRRNWDRLVYSGIGQAPITVKTEQEMRSLVAATPGAIGYISKEYLNDTIRVLQIKK